MQTLKIKSRRYFAIICLGSVISAVGSASERTLQDDVVSNLKSLVFKSSVTPPLVSDNDPFLVKIRNFAQSQKTMAEKNIQQYDQQQKELAGLTEKRMATAAAGSTDLELEKLILLSQNFADQISSEQKLLSFYDRFNILENLWRLSFAKVRSQFHKVIKKTQADGEVDVELDTSGPQARRIIAKEFSALLYFMRDRYDGSPSLVTYHRLLSNFNILDLLHIDDLDCMGIDELLGEFNYREIATADPNEVAKWFDVVQVYQSRLTQLVPEWADLDKTFQTIRQFWDDWFDRLETLETQKFFYSGALYGMASRWDKSPTLSMASDLKSLMQRRDDCVAEWQMMQEVYATLMDRWREISQDTKASKS